MIADKRRLLASVVAVVRTGHHQQVVVERARHQEVVEKRELRRRRAGHDAAQVQVGCVLVVVDARTWRSGRLRSVPTPRSSSSATRPGIWRAASTMKTVSSAADAPTMYGISPGRPLALVVAGGHRVTGRDEFVGTRGSATSRPGSGRTRRPCRWSRAPMSPRATRPRVASRWARRPCPSPGRACSSAPSTCTSPGTRWRRRDSGPLRPPT